MTSKGVNGLDKDSLDKADSILKLIASEGQKLSETSDSRENVIGLARDLIFALETPLEAILWMIWAEPARGVASRVALDLKLFETLTQDHGRPKTVHELAKPTGASSALVNRIARQLAAMRMVDETGEEEYAPNKMTYVLNESKHSGGVLFCYDACGPAFMHTADFLVKNKLQNPQDSTKSPFSHAKGVDPFTWFNQNPHIFGAFHEYVHGQRIDRPAWVDEGFYPVKERLIDGMSLEADKSALVDVGGGAGQSLQQFIDGVPEWKGRLVLQELPSVIDYAKTTKLDDRIELTAHDFFKEQPIKGARAYYLRSVLHDWSDESCLQILGKLKEAMEPGYSKILINDHVVANKKAAWQHASLDLFMMALASSQERTENEWRNLIAKSGLQVKGIWSQGKGNESIIELEA